MTTLRILLVDDNRGDVELVQLALKGWRDGCEIMVANDGGEALECLRTGPFAEQKPDLILLDINMPGMDGKECLKRLQSDEELRSLPVSMLSSSEIPTEIIECYQLNASCYVVKPFDGREFISVVRKLIAFWANIIRLSPPRPMVILEALDAAPG